MFIFELDSKSHVSVIPDLARAAVEIEPQDVDCATVIDVSGQLYTPVADGMNTRLVSTGDPDRDALERRSIEYAAERNVPLPDGAADAMPPPINQLRVARELATVIDGHGTRAPRKTSVRRAPSVRADTARASFVERVADMSQLEYETADWQQVLDHF